MERLTQKNVHTYVHMYMYIYIYMYTYVYIHKRIHLHLQGVMRVNLFANRSVWTCKLQHTATHCNTLLIRALHSNIHDYQNFCCSLSVPLKEKICDWDQNPVAILAAAMILVQIFSSSGLGCMHARRSVLQYFAVCCSVLQCVAVCSSVLQRSGMHACEVHACVRYQTKRTSYQNI